jgi:HAMP domain-containing protein
MGADPLSAEAARTRGLSGVALKHAVQPSLRNLMKLLLKFNLVFVLVFVLGLGISGYVSRDLLQRNAREEILGHARLLMEKAAVVRSFTSQQITPLLETQMKYTFLPQSVPSYAAAEVLAALHKTYPDYNYKDAMLNPTNPRDRAEAWEVDLVSHFRNTPASTEFIGHRDTPTGPSLYIAKPILISDAACLRCHSTVDAAPKTMVDHYGPANGFGWKLNEPIGAQLVSVPMSVPLARASHTFGVFMASLTAVFVLIGLALNLMLWKIVIKPVTRLSALADRVSMGEMDAPDFASRSRDEIGVLTESFTRMRKSLVQAMKMLDG